jgi:hypothetical protein
VRRLDNPLLTNELRTRMRGGRAAWLLLAYLGALALLLFVAYASWFRAAYGAGGRNDLGAPGGGGGAASFAIGGTFYQVLFVVQALLVALITPALTAGAVTLEREQRTYELLTVSLLPRRALVVGKLTGAVGFVGLLLASSLPLASLCFLLGGVSPGEVAAAAGLLLLCAWLYGAVGVAWSAVARNTTSATVLAYATNGLLFFATLPLTLPNLGGAFGGWGGRTPAGLQALNPVGAVLFGAATERYFGVSVPAWLPAAAVNALLAVIVTTAAVHRLELPRTDRSAVLRLLTAGFVLLLAVCLYGFLLPAGQGAFGGLPAVRQGWACALTALAPAALVPVFATADRLPERGGLLCALDPRRLLRGEAPSGLTYALLVLAFCCGPVLLLGAPAGKARAFAGVLGMTLAVGLAIGALGLFATAKFRSRWYALFFTLVGSSGVAFCPGLALADWWQRADWRPSALDNLLYLLPLPAAQRAADPSAFAPPQPLHLWFGAGPSPAVTAAIYLILAAVLFAATARADRRYRRVTVSPGDAGGQDAEQSA